MEIISDNQDQAVEYFSYTIEHFRQKERTRAKWWKFERRGHHHDSVRSPQSWAASQRHLKRTHYSGPCIPVRNSGIIYTDSTVVLESLWCDEVWNFVEAWPTDVATRYPDENEIPRYRVGNKALNVPQSTQRKIGARGRKHPSGPKRKRSRKPDKDNLYSLLNVMRLLTLKGYPPWSMVNTFRIPEDGGLFVYCGYRENISQSELNSMGMIYFRNVSRGGRALSRRSLELDGLWDKLPWFAKGILDAGSFDLLDMVGSSVIVNCGFDLPGIWDRLPLPVKIYFVCKDIYPEWRRSEAVGEILSRMRVPPSQNATVLQFLTEFGVLTKPKQ